MGRYLPWFNILGIITSHSTLFDQGIHCIRRAGVSTSQEFLGILSFCDKIWLVKWLNITIFRKGTCISTYPIRNHQHWHPWWQARPIQRPREQSSCWTSSWWIATLFCGWQKSKSYKAFWFWPFYSHSNIRGIQYCP